MAMQSRAAQNDRFSELEKKMKWLKNQFI